MTALLQVERLSAGYGDVQALFDVSLTLEQGATAAIIGANGAGKSTLLRALTGLLTPTRGTIRLGGQDITRVPTHRRVAAGIAMAPEGRRLFANLTVEDNLRVAARAGRPGQWTLKRVFALFPLVEQCRTRRAVHLSGGEQQAVAISRALLANPSVLLLDEVSLGLAPVVVRQLYQALPEVLAAGTAVLLVEQDVRQALDVADHVHCLLEGRTALTGRPEDLTKEAITNAYFGI
jgi:branched-chain amino acid transport system ATP-binding protein